MLKLILYMIMLPTIALSQEKIGDNGLYEQDWFHQSFLEFNDDAIEASESGKY